MNVRALVAIIASSAACTGAAFLHPRLTQRAALLGAGETVAVWMTTGDQAADAHLYVTREQPSHHRTQ
jgi:hypothetical protein